MLLEPLFWYCEIQGFHTFLGLRSLDPHQGSARDLSGAYNVPRPPAMLSNDLRSLHILSKTRLSIPHLLGGDKILSVFCRGGEIFLTLPLQENYILPPHMEKMIHPLKLGPLKNSSKIEVLGKTFRYLCGPFGIASDWIRTFLKTDAWLVHTSVCTQIVCLTKFSVWPHVQIVVPFSLSRWNCPYIFFV